VVWDLVYRAVLLKFNSLSSICLYWSFVSLDPAVTADGIAILPLGWVVSPLILILSLIAADNADARSSYPMFTWLRLCSIFDLQSSMAVASNALALVFLGFWLTCSSRSSWL
jgi:hypothetical protein